MNLYEKRIIQKSDFILCATENIFKDIKTIADDKKIIILKNGYINKKIPIIVPSIQNHSDQYQRIYELIKLRKPQRKILKLYFASP